MSGPETTGAVERAAWTIWPRVGGEDLRAGRIARARDALAAALDVDEMARVAHADDVAHGRASVSWEDLDGDARDWYLSNARAVRTATLGSDR